MADPIQGNAPRVRLRRDYWDSDSQRHRCKWSPNSHECQGACRLRTTTQGVQSKGQDCLSQDRESVPGQSQDQKPLRDSKSQYCSWDFGSPTTNVNMHYSKSYSLQPSSLHEYFHIVRKRIIQLYSAWHLKFQAYSFARTLFTILWLLYPNSFSWSNYYICISKYGLVLGSWTSSRLSTFQTLLFNNFEEVLNQISMCFDLLSTRLGRNTISQYWGCFECGGARRSPNF